MKKNKITMLLISFILALLPIISIKVDAIDLTGYSNVLLEVADAGEQFNITNWIDSEQSYVKINGTQLDQDTIGNFDYNSSTDFFMVWKIPNSAKAELTKELYYPLPDTVRFNGNSGTLKDGGNVVGTWEISDGKVLINYNDEFINNLDGNNDLVGTLHVYGALGKSEPEDNTGEDITISFPGFKDFNVHVEKPNVYSDLNIYKYIENGDVANTLEDRQFVIQITSQGSAYTNVVITDTMGDALKLNGDLVLYDETNNIITDFTWKTNSEGFEVTIPTIPANTSYYLKYKVSVLDDYVNTGELVDDDHYESERNVAVMKSDDLDYNKTATSFINITKYKLEKNASYDVDNKIMNYTITVNGGYQTDMGGSILKDVLSENQDYIQGSFYVEVNGVKTDIQGLTFETLKNGYMFPGDSDDLYTIHYQTKVQDTGITVKNDVSLFVPSQGETKEETTETYIPKELDLIKRAIEYDEENRIITWETQLVISEEIGALNYINIVDSFSANMMKYVEGSFKINLDTFDPSWVIPSDWGGFTVFLGTVDPGQTDKFIQPGIYTMTYQTQIVETMSPGTHIYNNNISFEYNGGKVSADATYTVEVPENILNKIVLNDSNYYFYPSEYYNKDYLTYILEIEPIDEATENFLISDFIPEGTSYVEGSAKFLGEDTWQPLENGELDVKVTEDDKISFIFSEETNSRFFTELKRNDLRFGKNYIMYNLKFDNELYGTHTFKNTAYAVVDGEQYPEVSAIIDRDLGKPLSKSYQYSAETAPIVTYTININPNAGDLNPNADTLEVSDIMGSGLDFVRGSLTINGEKNNNYQYNDETHELTFSVPDAKAIEVTYRCYVNLQPDTNFTEETSSNTVKIYGTSLDNDSTSTQINGKVYEANGTTSGVGNSVTIYKYENGILNNALGGISFNIYKANTKLIDGVVTVDENDPYGDIYKTVKTSDIGDIGYARVSGMSADTVYILSEIESDNYYKAADIYFVISGHDNNTYSDEIVTILSSENNHTFNINNEKKPEEPEIIVQVEKRSESADGQLLAGAILQLWDGNNCITEWETTTEAKVFTDLEIGKTYTIKEISAPEGYELAEDKTFTVQDIEATQTIKMIDIKKEINPIVSIIKTDVGEKPLAGAILQLWDGNNCITEWETTTEAKVFTDLEIGKTYTIKEISAPEGYELAEDKTFTVEEKEEIQEISMIDIKKEINPTVSIIKTDVEETPLAGAILQLWDGNNFITEWETTTEAKVFTDLEIGKTYTIKEISAPEGYILTEDKTFTVEEKEEIQEISMINLKEVIDVPIVTKIQISKLDESREPLSGATLEIIDEKNNVIANWETTTEIHEIIGILQPGKTYILHEVSAPMGYQKADDIQLVIKETNDIQSFEMIDEETDITVKIDKKDESGAHLVGAKLQIIDSEGTVIDEWITDGNSHTISKKLIIGAEYTIHEVEAPEGYEKAKDQSFTVKDTEEEQIYTMFDIKIPTKITVQINKETEAGTSLKGAKLVLIDEEGTIIEQWVSDGNPHVISSDKLVIGKNYTVREIEAPPGFEIAEDINFTVKDTEDIQEYTMIDIKIPTEVVVQISKYNDSNELLSGAKLQILDKNNNVIETWITNGKVHTVEAELIIGETYILHEVSAPEGYKLAKDIEFTIEDTNDVQEIKMINIKKSTIVSPDTGDNTLTTYLTIGLLSLIAILASLFTIKRLNKKEIS